MVSWHPWQRRERVHERRLWRHGKREPGLRDELAYALWRLSRRQKRDDGVSPRPLRDQRIALLHVVSVQRLEIAELREELARVNGILDQVRYVDRVHAEMEWDALRAVADHEEAGMIEEFALSGPEFTAGGSGE